MNDLDRSLENTFEVEKFSLAFKSQALQQLILLRFQALTILSSIGFAVIGIIISVKSDFIKNPFLALLSVILLIVIALVSFGRYLYLIRSDIKDITQKIKSLPARDWNIPLEEKESKVDYWPETLFIFLVFGIVLFGLSFIVCL